MKLLIIDDEPAIVETVEGKMRKEGFTTFTADSAEEGMRLFRRVKPDLIILDIMLPHRSGFEFCRAVRKDSATPIIFVSARADETDRVKGLELGADDYLKKPVDLDDLMLTIDKVMQSKRLRQQLDFSAIRGRQANEPVTLIGNSPAICQLRDALHHCAP